MRIITETMCTVGCPQVPGGARMVWLPRQLGGARNRTMTFCLVLFVRAASAQQPCVGAMAVMVVTTCTAWAWAGSVQLPMNGYAPHG